MDWKLISEGLTLSLLGLLTTFVALGLFILSMVMLKWLFPNEKRRKPGHSAGTRAETRQDPDELTAVIAAAWMCRSGAVEDGRAKGVHDMRSEEMAAAIAAALMLQDSKPTVPTMPGHLGARLEQPHGRWWQTNGNGFSQSHRK